MLFYFSVSPGKYNGENVYWTMVDFFFSQRAETISRRMGGLGVGASRLIVSAPLVARPKFALL